ncbi:hypothetical protein [Roseateles flavus]|uniref:Uncharacterized protein n=1 Tax=Roseateles flavus TaxID=3149041 RepID=A0ABV0GKP4_9BURK
MNDNDTVEKRSRSWIQRLFSNSLIFAVMITLLSIFAVYLSAVDPTVRKLAAGGVFGAAIGIAYILESCAGISPYVLRILCAAVGALAAGVMCLLLLVSTTSVVVGVIVGGLLGATSKYWIAHINLP